MSSLAPGWTTATLGQLISSMSNGMSGTQNKDGRGVPVSRIETIAGQRIDYSRIGFIADFSEDVLPRYRLCDGDILFSHINSPAHIGKTAVFSGDTTLYHGINLLRIQVEKSVCDFRFFNYACNLLRANGTFSLNAQHAVNQSSLNQAKISAFEISLPPRSEQQRIADKLDTVLVRVDAVNDRLARIAPLLKRFRQSVLAAATSGRLTADWREDDTFNEYPKRRIAEFGSARLGKMLNKQKNTGIETRYLRNVNVRWFGFDLSDLQTLRIEPHERETLQIVDGDLLICEGGEPGRCAVWRAGETDIVFQKALHRVRVDKTKALPSWIAFCLKSLCDSAALNDLFTGTTIKHLTGIALAQVEFPMPSVEEQTEIVRRVDLLFAFADRLEARLQAAQTASARLTPALLAKAFRGELVPQDPNDEPAAELLRRLAQSKPEPTKKPRARKATT